MTRYPVPPPPLRLASGLALALLLALAPVGAQAACYADYKAKQDDPLRLHYGVAELYGGCSTAAAEAELAPRLEASGWVLLTVMSVFGPEGLAEREDSAGGHFLAY